MGDLWSLLTRRSSASGRLFKRLDSISSRLFYRHGLFCASHPYLTLFFSFVLMFFLSSPVILQLYGHLTQPPQPVPTLLWETSASHFSSGLSHVKEKFGTEPYLRLEQIVVNVTGLPSDGGSDRGVLSDSILAYAMSLHEAISRTVVDGSSGGLGNQKKFSLADICYMPPGIERCLVHSPLEYWGSESERFAKDVDHLATVSDSSILSSLGIPIPLESVFSGLRFDAASRKVIGAESLLFTYFLSSKPPEEQLQARIPDVWDRLWTEAFKSTRHFTTSIGASEALKPTEWRSDGAPRLLYYEFGSSTSIFTGESLVLGVMYIIVFLYISLVLGKVDLVKSKFALGFGAVITVFTGLVMSVGLCSFLGVQTSLVPWEALPFLLIVVGMENIFVLTNSVVMTSLDLPVKERVGIGLSKVGASMTASLGGEMCLLLLASLTSIPTLQEFCLFGAVSLVMDYFMQITFFVTILSIDIRRLEICTTSEV
ncbi:sterol-sensing domain of SREBP cleavage-activation-domain-containing protein [Fimicolochytrium jonesii]|uniref:sterol-sensing domain of SREBP cleavage-activation-domain-containing protein n=1 Tax=Fimicolochytrium jonesii TaxID=1396493 RepID=UPI0022FEB554|nr:sterol-sensing domain of SREBP cleavage-activation-domain-containing protein [Fimicolochytrium jonesii]KAI8821348.1 sterol-sensing domain of SREBP cleavage-activation-domain-containing protein [Fimicolochytrium jonesii]